MESKWPREITQYLQKLVLGRRSPAFLVTDGNGKIVSYGGDAARYGLAGAKPGERAADRVCCLEGLLPLDSPSSVIRWVQAGEHLFADLHLIRVPEGDCVVFLDVTEEVTETARVEEAFRGTEEQLRQSEKMEALGRLAGGVAHDFNNLLTVILGYSRMLMGWLPPGQLRASAEEISRSAERAAAMTGHLLSFSRRQTRRVELIDLNASISHIQNLLRRLIGEDIRLTLELETPLRSIVADASQMEQILINLAANARDAMPGGGSLEIRTANLTSGPGSGDWPAAHFSAGECVSLTVTDTGCGMDAETRARAFEPFFTSKALGYGTGLGLSIVHGVVLQSGGVIDLSSEPGKGTRVTILFPAVNAAPVRAQDMVDEEMPAGSETVMVVEDEEPVRQLVREILGGLGYAVIDFALPEAALESCKNNPRPIDLLLTDFVMPGMNGGELAARMCALRPGIAVMYVSGYAQDRLTRGGAEPPAGVFLRKPFTPSELAQRVREALVRKTRAGSG